MTRISDLSAIETPSLESVMVISDGQLTQKITLEDLKDAIIDPATRRSLGVVQVGNGKIS